MLQLNSISYMACSVYSRNSDLGGNKDFGSEDCGKLMTKKMTSYVYFTYTY